MCDELFVILLASKVEFDTVTRLFATRNLSLPPVSNEILSALGNLIFVSASPVC